MTTLFAGVARSVINPPLGIRRAGIRIFADPIQAIESDLTATVLVLSDGNTKLAIAALDLATMSMPEMAELRSRIAAAIDAPTSHVLVNLSHTHSSPAFPDFIPEPPEQMALKEQYRDHVFERAAAAAAKAAAGLQPARIGCGRGECGIGVYRRATGPDGRGLLGEVPEAPVDPTVGVIRVDDFKGEPIATLFSYGCHPVVMGPRAHVASSDFPGAARDVVERSLGALSLFLQACGGNINPIGGIGYEVDGRDTRRRVGTVLGGEVLKVAAEIRTHVYRGKQRPIGPLANILLWPWEPVSGESCTFLDAVEETETLQFGPLPTREEAVAIHEKWSKKLAEDRARGAHDWDMNFNIRFVYWSERLLAAIEHGEPTLDVNVHAVRINDIVLLGLSVESFFETGLTLKQASPFGHTEVLGYTNGCVAYLPRAEDYPEGGWQIDELYSLPDMFCQSYGLPIAPREDAEQKVVERARVVMEKLNA
jgi:hypothetical protein